MSLATVLSRIAGVLRETVFAAVVGADRIADAFVFAFRIPNLLRDFFAEGALSSAFVPVFAATREREGDEKALTLARRVLGTLLAVTGLVAIAGIVFAPALVSVIAWDAPDEIRPLTVRLTRVMWPFLPLVAVAAVAMGVLNAHRRYFVPAVAPAFFNVVSIVGGLGLLWAGFEASEAVLGWAVLVVLGGAAQFLVQVPALRAVGWRGRPTADLAFRDPALRTIVRRMGPVVVSLAGTNVMLVVATALASRGAGWAASLNYAFRLVHLPIGVVGVAVGTVVLAAGARRNAAGDEAGLDGLVRSGLRLNWFLALPAAVGLFVLAEPIVRLLYEHGRFTAADTADVALALRWYAGGIVFYAGVKAAAPQFLARGDTRTPMTCSLLGIGANLLVSVLLVGRMGLAALAFAVAVGAAVNYGALRLLARMRRGRGSAPQPGFLLRVVPAAGLMGGAAWAADRWVLSGDAGMASPALAVALTLGAIAALAGLYFLVAAALGVEEAGWLRRRLLRKTDHVHRP